MRPLTVDQAVCLTVMTGALVCPPDIFKAEIEKKLHRVVGVVEFTDDTFVKDLQRIYEADFKDLCKVVPDSGILVFK